VRRDAIRRARLSAARHNRTGAGELADVRASQPTLALWTVPDAQEQWAK